MAAPKYFTAGIPMSKKAHQLVASATGRSGDKAPQASRAVMPPDQQDGRVHGQDEERIGAAHRAEDCLNLPGEEDHHCKESLGQPEGNRQERPEQSHGHLAVTTAVRGGTLP
jgi:hypothetical protein